MPIHPVTGMMLEDGHGALPAHIQAKHHCDQIERDGNPARADELRTALGIPTRAEATAAAEERAAAPAERADTSIQHHERIADLEGVHAEHHDRLTALEENAAEHKSMKDRIVALEESFKSISLIGTMNHGSS